MLEINLITVKLNAAAVISGLTSSPSSPAHCALFLKAELDALTSFDSAPD